MATENFAGVLPPPIIPFDDVPPNWGGDTPEYATLREVDFQPTENGNLEIFYSRGSNHVDLANLNGIQGLIDRLIETNYDYYEIPEEPDWNAPPDPDPYATRLSLQNSGLRYIVYVLSNRNWQFTRIGRPITLGKRAADSEAYATARRVWASGGGGYDLGTPFDADERQAKNRCRIAYMIADGTKARATDANYVHRINLHVDLKFDGPGYMPIMVDPDIRFPGGSED